MILALDAATSALSAVTSARDAAIQVLDAATQTLGVAISTLCSNIGTQLGVSDNISNCSIGIIPQMSCFNSLSRNTVS